MNHSMASLGRDVLSWTQQIILQTLIRTCSKQPKLSSLDVKSHTFCCEFGEEWTHRWVFSFPCFHTHFWASGEGWAHHLWWLWHLSVILLPFNNLYSQAGLWWQYHRGHCWPPCYSLCLRFFSAPLPRPPAHSPAPVGELPCWTVPRPAFPRPPNTSGTPSPSWTCLITSWNL